MKNILLFFFLCITLSFCTSTKETTIKIPKVKGQKWFTNKSLKEYSQEFLEKDWTIKDTSSLNFLDSLQIEKEIKII